MRFRKKPVVIEAVQWTGKNLDEIKELAKDTPRRIEAVGNALVIFTLEGDHIAPPGDWIIKGVQGELYPCKPDIFEKTYEVVNDE